MLTHPDWLVSTEWLAANLSAPDLVVLDGSWHMPASGRDGLSEFEAAHIPGALYFDIAKIADTDSGLPHTLANPVQFASTMRKMGIGDGARIVVYEAGPMFSAPRVWWNFRVMGFHNVSVLDGGLAKWVAEDRPTEDGPARPRTAKHFTARRDSSRVRDKSDVLKASTTGSPMVVDVRSPGRFSGEEAEPRAGMRSGHMPGAANLHYATLLDGDGRLKPIDDLKALFAEAGIAPNARVITSCGSGVTAAILTLALAVAGNDQSAVYDGSWSEWGADPDVPIVTGT